MNVGAEEKRKRLIAGALGVVAAGLVGYQLYDAFGPSGPAPQAVIVAGPVIRTVGEPSGPPAVKIGTAGTQLDPSLHMEAMLVTESLVYGGSGRNIFSAILPAPPPPKLVQANFPARGPVAPTGPPPAPRDPGPPPINLKFFGTATARDGSRKAFLLNGDDVFVASAGDIVERRYRVVSVAANSVLIEDLPNSNKQTLPLMGN